MGKSEALPTVAAVRLTNGGHNECPPDFSRVARTTRCPDAKRKRRLVGWALESRRRIRPPLLSLRTRITSIRATRRKLFPLQSEDFRIERIGTLPLRPFPFVPRPCFPLYSTAAAAAIPTLSSIQAGYSSRVRAAVAPVCFRASEGVRCFEGEKVRSLWWITHEPWNGERHESLGDCTSAR